MCLAVSALELYLGLLIQAFDFHGGGSLWCYYITVFGGWAGKGADEMEWKSMQI